MHEWLAVVAGAQEVGGSTSTRGPARSAAWGRDDCQPLRRPPSNGACPFATLPLQPSAAHAPCMCLEAVYIYRDAHAIGFGTWRPATRSCGGWSGRHADMRHTHATGPDRAVAFQAHKACGCMRIYTCDVARELALQPVGRRASSTNKPSPPRPSSVQASGKRAFSRVTRVSPGPLPCLALIGRGTHERPSVTGCSRVDGGKAGRGASNRRRGVLRFPVVHIQLSIRCVASRLLPCGPTCCLW